MARVINKSRLESYVESYLRQHLRRYSKTKQVNLLRKARTFIVEKLTGECCSGEQPVVDLFTGDNNDFTNTVYTLLLQMSVNGNRNSLQRAIDLIDAFIEACCGDSEDITTTLNLPEDGGDLLIDLFVCDDEIIDSLVLLTWDGEDIGDVIDAAVEFLNANAYQYGSWVRVGDEIHLKYPTSPITCEEGIVIDIFLD